MTAAEAHHDLKGSLAVLQFPVFAHVFIPKPVTTFERHVVCD